MSSDNAHGQRNLLFRIVTYPFRLTANILLMLLIPRHIKRMVFLVAIQNRLSDEHVLLVSSLERLNAKMNIAQDPAVLRAAKSIATVIPIDDDKLYAFISCDMQADQAASRDRRVNNAKLLINGIPAWLNYGGDHMVRDINQLISPCRAEATA